MATEENKLSATGEPDSDARAALPPDHTASMEVVELSGDEALREWSDSVLVQDFSDSILSAFNELVEETRTISEPDRKS